MLYRRDKIGPVRLAENRYRGSTHATIIYQCTNAPAQRHNWGSLPSIREDRRRAAADELVKVHYLLEENVELVMARSTLRWGLFISHAELEAALASDASYGGDCQWI